MNMSEAGWWRKVVSVALQGLTGSRTVRLSALVTPPEAEQIAGRAAEAGVSVSAYLREQALRSAGRNDDPAAARQIDALIDGMHRQIDGAIAAVRATVEELSRP